MRIHPGSGNGLRGRGSRGSGSKAILSEERATIAHKARVSDEAIFGTRKRDLRAMLAEAAANTAQPPGVALVATPKPKATKRFVNMRRW